MASASASAAETLSIGEVAARAGLQPSAIRFYERAGLLPPPERTNGRRRFDPAVLQLLAVIEVSKQAGFTLKEIAQLLRGFGEDTPPPERWRALAEGKLAELDALSRRLDSMRALLHRGLECGCLRLEDCEVLATEPDTRGEPRTSD